MKFAISNIAWQPSERLEVYDIMEEMGVSGLEIAPSLFFNTATNPFSPPRNLVCSAVDEITSRGIKIVSMQSILFGLPRVALFGSETGFQNFVLGIERALKLAGQLGIENIVFGCPRQRLIPKNICEVDALEFAKEVFKNLGETAKKLGTKISIEANPKEYGTNFLNTFEEVVKFVDQVNHPNITCILDLGAMQMNEMNSDTKKMIEMYAPKINHVHVSEPNLQTAPVDLEALASVLESLEIAEYDKFVSIEMQRPSDGTYAIKKALRRLYQAKNQVFTNHI